MFVEKSKEIPQLWYYLIMYKLPERLRELRLEKNFTLVSLAKATGISKAAIGNWENNASTPNVYSIIKLAEFFTVSSDYLLGIKDF